MKEDQLEYRKYLCQKFINEEKDETSGGNNGVKNPKEKIISGLEGMKPGAVMQAVAKSLGKSSPEFLKSHILDILVNAAKSGKVKFDALKDSIKDFGEKNIEDSSNIDWDHVEIDPSGTSMKCMFDGDSKKIIDTFMKEYEKGMKDAKKDIEEGDKELRDDVKKAGIKIDDEKLDKNGLAVASVIDSKDSKKKSGKELEKEIDNKIKQSDKAKQLVKKAKESKKRLSNIKVGPKIEKMGDEELAKAAEESEKNAVKKRDRSKEPRQLAKSIQKKISAKLGDNYKKSLLAGVYKKDDVVKNAQSNKLGKIDLSKIKSNKIIGLKIDFVGSDASDLVQEADGKKASGYVVRQISNSDKNSSMKKIYQVFSKIIKEVLSEQAEGDPIAFFKHWQGKKDQKKLDSLFFFVGINKKSKKTNESLDESILNEEGLGERRQLGKDALDAIIAYKKEHGLPGDMSSLNPKDSMAIRKLPEVAKWLKTGTTGAKNIKINSISKIIMHSDSVASGTIKDPRINFILGKGITDKAEKAISKAVDNDEAKEIASAVKVGKDGTMSGWQGIGQYGKKIGISQDQIKDAFADFDDPTDRRQALEQFDLHMKAFYKDFNSGNKEKAIKSLLASANDDKQKDFMAEFAAKLDPESKKYFEDAGVKIDGKIDGIGSLKSTMKDAGSVMKGQASDALAAGIDDGPSDQFDKIPQGFANLGNGKTIPSFSYSHMSEQIKQLDRAFDDEIDSGEMNRFQEVGDKLNTYAKWAEENKDSDDDLIKQKIALIKRLNQKYDEMTLNHGEELQNTGAFDSPRVVKGISDVSDSQTKDVQKVSSAVSNDNDAQKAAGGWKKALGLDKAFTALGIARLAAKTTGIVLNHGKSLVDMVGKQAMKYKEDKGVIADFRVTLTNGEGSKSKFEDTKFAVRFNIDDCKWHATCLDNRKMKFPEDKLVKIALDSEEGKKFKKYCLSRWKSIFAPEDERRAIIPFIFKNSDKLGIDSGSLPKDFINNIKKMSDDFEKIEAAMK